MAPKRSAPLPPPAASSEDSSGSGSDESGDEEETAPSQSQAPAAPIPKQKVQEPEVSDDDDGEDDEEEEDEDEDDEDDERANHVTPHSTTTNNPPPPNQEESETSDEEEDEEADGKMPRPKPAPNQEAEGKGAKPSPSIQDKKRGAPFQSTWSTDDAARILEALAAHRLEHGKLPRTDALAAALAGSLDKSDCSQSELERKVKSLRSQYSKLAKKGKLPSRDHGRRLFDLSKSVWGYRSRAEANGVTRREVSEIYKLYPYLAEEVRAIEKARPGLFKRELETVDDGKARALDAKIKKQRLAQMKVYQHRYDLIKEVTKTLIDLDNQGK
ncbi:hypothetical protein U9M48_025782 [Paspalum notatum var. saurae]|uniref:Glabrous enhancer-binding protein-like DBD domain-containing protein n=1 Tax=Paspalum notatum var. saurae TaxID=547442 RepID=A0AAQ3TR54_PASNO